ncbi:MAG: chemotaxis protein CheX [Planctomycetota bacterium]|jgi:CheY-specific phosphatase CheX|nr:chemotaxis protein CheX [Planctomycetota bacterium]
MSDTTKLLQLDEQLVMVIVKSARDGLMMAGLKPNPVGISKFLQCRGDVSSIVGFVGPISGSMFINTSENTACFLAGRMLGETLETLDNQALDGLSEIANIIAGQTKAALSATEYKFDKISVPSVIVGNNYSISHYRGMTSVSVDFELPEMPIKPGDRATFSVNMSLMKI